MSLRRAFLSVLFVLASQQTFAATLPAGFSETVVASGLSSPTAMAFAPDGRIFVTQQGGQLRVIKNGTLLSTPFVSLTVSSSGERGLLGVAFDPQFATNNFVYVYYTTASSPIHNRLSRFTANGDVAAAGSEVVLLDLDNLSTATNHNGGAIHFGPDGKLYVAVGENANSTNSQTLSNLLGKMLRLNADGSIPTDNPFFNTATGKNRAIWALGLRNPFTFSFQSGSGRMFINDVGQNTWEEINDGVSGSNYGWPTTEGETTDSRFRSPLYVYAHGSTDTTGCAITGGAFYNPTSANFPASYFGRYFFADYCTGWIRLYDPTSDTAAPFASGIGSPVDLAVTDDGSLYYLARGGGVLGRIRYTANQAPEIVQQPSDRTVGTGQSVTFSVNATGSSPLSYEWQRNGSPISGATSSSYTIDAVGANDDGAQFRVVVSNAFGSATSNVATLHVTSNAPTASIDSPLSGATYAGGQTISYSGSASDAQDGVLPASAFSWTVVFHHDTHTHPFLGPVTGVKSGSFQIPQRGETATNVFYRITLTVTDSSGLTSTVTRDVVPRVRTITVATQPAGLAWTLDGAPTQVTSFSSVEGMIRAIGATTPQVGGGETYVFSSWSDGGTATHEITTPSSNVTLTATFTRGANSIDDVDGDDRADLLWRNSSSGSNAIWRMSGTSLLQIVDLPAIANSALRIGGASDFNGDGIADIVWRNGSSGSNALWLMQSGGTLGGVVDLPALPSAWESAGAGDLDGDGQSDLLWRNATTGQNAAWLMRGTALLAIVDLPRLVDVNWRIGGLGDFNADGRLDIVWRNAGDGRNAVWLMNGTSFSGIVDLPPITNTSLAISAVVDLDRDGHSDIVFRNQNSGANAVWMMNGTSLREIRDLPVVNNLSLQLSGPR